tara:strand:+ start:1232 stop:1642 length:411 start_codon:yes stop_codon:yes gene_type:complete
MNPSSDELKVILQEAKTIAVVGLSDNPTRDSFNVASYLKDNQYSIIPVNPTLQEVLGQDCFAELTDIDIDIDIVDIFRRSEFVSDIVDQAISIGAKCIWMQDGVIDQQSAQRASDAGLAVIMDDCILRQHKRLFSA